MKLKNINMLNLKKLKSILLIDDDEATNFYNQLIIKEANITDTIYITLNGKEALNFLTSKGQYGSNNDTYPAPSLILLDINMPVMNGWSFIEEYKRLDDTQKAEIIVVILTTSLNPDDIFRAENYKEIKEFMNKPLTVDILMEIFEKHFKDKL